MCSTWCRRMKLLIVTNLFPNSVQLQRGLFNAQQAAQLAKTHEVRVVAPVRWVPRWLAPWAPLARVPVREEVYGLSVEHPRYLAVPLLSRPLNALLFYWGIRGVVRRLARRERFDHMMATWAYPDVVAASWVARECGLPLVAKLHGSDVHVYSRGPLRRRMIVRALRSARRIIAVSDAIRGELARWGIPQSRIVVLPNGVDVNLFSLRDRATCRKLLGLPNTAPLIVFIGNLVAVKGVSHLLEALRMCRARPGLPAAGSGSVVAARAGGVRPTLAIVGDGAEGMALRREAAALGLTDVVRFAGARSHEEIPLWLNAADVLCLPSVSEGCPNVVVEALACGTPVVASRVGGIPELVQDGVHGILVNPQDAASLAQGLKHALQHTWDRERLRASVAGQGWAENAARLSAVLEASAPAPEQALTVLHVLRYSIPNLSGYTVRSQALIEGQARLGVRPVVITSVRHDAAVAC